MKYAVSVKKLSVTIEGQTVLDEVSCEIAPGSITGLLGPSGSGKTTLMRAIVGIRRATGGSVTVLDLAAGDKRLREQIGYVTQTPSIYADLTVLENLRYFADVLGQESDVDGLIEELELGHKRTTLVSKLSGGETARVSLAVALLAKPKLLVMDEPTVGLDPLLRRDLWKRFHALAARGVTLIVSSHVMDEAAHCDRILLLRNGAVLADTTLDQLQRDTDQKNPEEAFIALVDAK